MTLWQNVVLVAGPFVVFCAQLTFLDWRTRQDIKRIGETP